VEITKDIEQARGVRPRTAPIEILNTFSTAAQAAARAAIETRSLPDWVGEIVGRKVPLAPLKTKWQEARAHILAGLPMGGSPAPNATINGQKEMLSEYRTASTTQLGSVFWKGSDADPSDDPDPDPDKPR